MNSKAHNLAIAYAVKKRFTKSRGGDEDLSPASEPEHSAENAVMKQMDFDKKAQEHEDLAEPAEPSRHVLPHMARGGIVKSPSMVAQNIMKMRKMAKGGMVESDDRPEGDESIDNFGYEDHPDNDFLADEEQTPYFNPNQADLREPDAKERRKSMISNIMRGLHAKHLGK